jgi:hypothetical protein
MREIKINNDTFIYSDGGCQLSFGSHATLHYTFDLHKYHQYKHDLLTLFDSRIRFDIVSTKYIAKSTIIKTLDIDNNFLTLTMKCEVINALNTDERREDLLEELLNSTFND